jgi:hypothetical protein
MEMFCFRRKQASASGAVNRVCGYFHAIILPSRAQRRRAEE